MPKRTDEEILFPEKTIAGIAVAPWSFGALFEISDPLEVVLDKIDETGLGEKLIDENGDINFTYLNLARLFTIAGTELLGIISKTLDVDEKTIKELSIKDGMAIILLMYYQNKEMIVSALKNAFSPLQEETPLKKAVKKAVKTVKTEKKKLK